MSERTLQSLVTAILTAAFVATAPALHAQGAADHGDHGGHHAQVVQVVAEDYALDLPDVIDSGWTTLQFRNDGEETHMVFIARLPDGVTFERYELEAQVPFNEVWKQVRDGRITTEEAYGALGDVLPEWYPGLGFVGGPGLVAPGGTSRVTLHLEPGQYAVECYVKTEDGEAHYMEGMARPLVVRDAPSDAAPPAADIRVTLSNDGMTVDGDLTPGQRTVEVHVIENPEVGFGHSVHFARLNGEAEVDDVVAWMNWFDVQGLREPAPAEFAGGMHPMGAGETAYFTVDLEPGRYLALSEATGAQGVLQEFTVR